MKRRAAVATLVALSGLGLAFRAPAPSLLLITIDTLRADHLGTYGYRSAHTPHLDRLAASGVVFENAFTHSPVTLSSHATLLTGRLPFEHGVRSNSLYRLPDDEVTLAEVLVEAGYRTAAFVSAAALDHRFGLGQGFLVYGDQMNPAGADQLIAERTAADVVSAAQAWLSEVGDAPFFLWVHFFDPHHPYDPPEPFHSRFADAPYDGEIAYTDQEIGRLLEGLTAIGRRSNTLVVVASDHGEGLGEHGELTHGIFVYDSTLRVPLVLAGPGFPSGARIERGPVGLVDVLPTVLAKLGLESPPHIAGHDLFADESSDVLYAETYLPRDFYNWSPLHALRSSRVKFIEAPHPELYDLDADPGETSNIIGLRARTARQLSDALTDLVAAEKATDSSFQPDPGLLSDLQSLGYVGGGVPSSARPPADDRLPDPKEKIGLVADLDEVIGLFGSQRFEEADRKVQKILESDPENFLATHYLGETLFELGRDREAIQAYRQAIERGHETPYHHFRLGLLHERLGEYSSAAQEFGRAVELSPAAAVEVLERARDLLRQEKLEGALGYLEMLKERGSRGPALALMLASAWGQKGETEKALRAIEDGLIGEAENPQLLSANGRLLAELGRLQEAIISLEKALPGLTEPDDRLPVLRTLAGLYGERGKLEKSIGYFEQAVALEPSDFETVANLALTMVRAGKTDAALGPLTHAIELRPDEVRLLNLKAEVLYRRGELEASRDLLRRSLAIRPDQPRIRQALAEVEGKLESR